MSETKFFAWFCPFAWLAVLSCIGMIVFDSCLPSILAIPFVLMIPYGVHKGYLKGDEDYEKEVEA